MHIELTYDDYLWLDLQKHLLELQELTTDVTYSQIVYKILAEDNSEDDVLTYNKREHIIELKTPNLEYFDYFENKNKFVLQQIINTIKYIKSHLSEGINEDPQKFFYSIFNKQKIEDNQKTNIYSNLNTKVTVADNGIKSVRAQKLNKQIINDSIKASTRVKKS